MSRPIGRDLSGYYRLHAPIYDWTRPAFLFGRKRLVRELARIGQAQGMHRPSILEIGCGTGHNLAALRSHFPQSRLVGVDLAAPMLERARKRLGNSAELVHGALGEVDLRGRFDIVLASYMLSMTGAAQAPCITAARRALAPGGLLAVVDFHSTPSSGFAAWMARNHVRFEPDLPQRLQAEDSPLLFRSRSAYAGLWRYFMWIGH